MSDNSFKFTVIDTDSLDDVTDDVEKFEITETHKQTKAQIWISGKHLRLRLRNKHSENKVYSIKVTDSQGYVMHRMMEVM